MFLIILYVWMFVGENDNSKRNVIFVGLENEMVVCILLFEF